MIGYCWVSEHSILLLAAQWYFLLADDIREVFISTYLIEI